MDNENVEVVEKQEEASTQEKQATETKTFTQEELNAILAKEKGKWEKKAEADKEEAKKLAKMNAEEKAKYESEKREADLARREAEINKRELTAEAKSILSEKGLPLELHELLNYETAETVKSSIDTIEKALQLAVEKAVEERMKGTAPQKGGSNEKPNFFELGAKIK